MPLESPKSEWRAGRKSEMDRDGRQSEWQSEIDVLQVYLGVAGAIRLNIHYGNCFGQYE